MKIHDNHKESALYWSAVSMIVCEETSVEQAAARLGLNLDRLRDILDKRQEPLTPLPYPPTRPISNCAS